MRSGRLVWRTRFLWLLGFLATAGSSGFAASRILFAVFLSGSTLEFGQRLTDVILPLEKLLLSTPLASWLLWGGAAFLISTGYWLIVILAEGALIASVLGSTRGQPRTPWQAVRAAWTQLSHFIAIDALIFLPLFILLLLMMLLGLGALMGTATLALSGAAAASMAGLIALSSICMLALLCLLLPVSLLTPLFRTLAFRDVMIRAIGARDSLGHTWRVVRRHLGTFFVLAILLLGGRYLLDLLTGIMVLPIAGLAALPMGATMAGVTFPATVLSWATWLVSAAAILLTVVLHALFHAFAATAWTLSYAAAAGETLENED